MENIGEHPLYIDKIKDSVRSTFEDLSDSKEKTTSSSRGDRNDVSGDGAVLTENTCNEEEEIDDPQNQYRVSVNEICLESYIPDYPVEVSSSVVTSSETNDNNLLLTQLAGNEVCSIAPGEGKHPVHFMQEKYCEELAFPVLFPMGRFGYQVERRVKLSPTKYFNARLLNYTGKFAANPEYLFLHSISQNRKSSR